LGGQNDGIYPPVDENSADSGINANNAPACAIHSANIPESVSRYWIIYSINAL
jgi:hypothetical protein